MFTDAEKHYFYDDFWSLFQRNHFLPECDIYVKIKELMALGDPLEKNVSEETEEEEQGAQCWENWHRLLHAYTALYNYNLEHTNKNRYILSSVVVLKKMVPEQEDSGTLKSRCFARTANQDPVYRSILLLCFSQSQNLNQGQRLRTAKYPTITIIALSQPV